MNAQTKKTLYPRRLRRSESFFGIHLDFHAGDDCTEIGKNVTRKKIETILDQVKPDYIQCDCKGHRGLCSYPTKVGYPAPGFVRDPLRIFRDVTEECGVALYMHYSGVVDMEAIKHHPSWALIDAKGKRSKDTTSVFGPYVDKLLIPQLKELCDEYDVDGVWVDGDCWGVCHEYNKEVLQAFKKETGIKSVPRKPEDSYFFEFTEFFREGFRRYLKHYVNALHVHNPNFQIASNWAYSSNIPEPITVDVDFISGDFTPWDSVNSARFEGRCLTRQGKPWDLMSWSFCLQLADRCDCTKSIPQLQQEAASVLALGGGYQAYVKQNRDGSVPEWVLPLLREVARFCRERQPFCHHAEAVPQIALLNSTAAFYRKTKRVFSPWENEYVPLKGVLQCLLESQNAVEVLSEHHLSGHLLDYPLIVIPEWEYLELKFKKELISYVEAGGNLLLIGPKSASIFRKELGITFIGETTDKMMWLEHGGWLAGQKTLMQEVRLSKKAESFGRLYPVNDFQEPSQIAASAAKHGKGKIAATYFNLGERYSSAATTVTRDFLKAIVRKLFPEPIVEVTGSHNVDVTVNRLNGKLMVNLVNTAGPHANNKVYVFDEIPPVGPLEVILRCSSRPRSILLQPAGQKLAFTYSNGQVKLTVPRLDLHEVLVVD